MPDTQNPDQFAPDCGATVDQLYQSAVSHVRAERRVSTAMVQRCLGIRYNLAARLIERMEREGLVSGANERGQRTIIVSSAHAQHTRGPWVAHDDLSITTVAGNAVVATVYGPGNACVSPEQAAADARLIAAAPDLLQASALALDWMRQHGALLRDMAPIEAAIAKAVQP